MSILKYQNELKYLNRSLCRPHKNLRSMFTMTIIIYQWLIENSLSVDNYIQFIYKSNIIINYFFNFVVTPNKK